MGLLPSLNGELITLAERAVKALERLADAAEAPSARPSAEVVAARRRHAQITQAERNNRSMGLDR